MGRTKIPGLIKRAGVWHIDKRVGGRRICQSTGTARLDEAERYLARLMEVTRQARVYGVRPPRSFEEGAAKFVLENRHKRSLDDDVLQLKLLMPWIGREPMDRLHLGTLQPWIEHRRCEGKATGTINHGLKIIRRIVNLAASEWVDDHGLTWLSAAPKIKLLPDLHKRPPYPLSWEDQERLFGELPEYLAQMALFAVNTGCRDQEICSLRWDWEVPIPQLGTSVFIIPGAHVKNGDERLVVLNGLARSVVEARRGTSPTHVFTYKGKPVTRMMTSAWKRARVRAGLPQARVHDLKHTFGRRLRAAGVSFEDRQDLLGHRSGRITTHYSAAELSHLITAADSACERDSRRPELVILRGSIPLGSRKTHASAHENGCVKLPSL
jgi:integrase